MQSCIQQIIHQDQNGFVRGRYIGANIRRVQDIIDSVRDSSDTSYILALDYEKAFDTLRWQTIFKALDFFGFGENFVASVETLFNDPQTCVTNAGYTSPYFSPSNGVRQGCCISPLLFIVAAELMALMVRNNDNIRGISINNTEYVVSQFADDTTCFIDSQKSGEAVMQTLELFSRFSGLRLNRRKSVAIPIGKQEFLPQTFCGLECVRKAYILGIWIANERSLDEHYHWNFQPQIQKMHNCCGTWSNRNLSLKGKVTIYNSLMISLLQYLVAYTITPPRVFNEVLKLACSFLWDNKENKVAYKWGAMV